jgi:endo-1,4-beta-xylanase
MKWDQIEPNRGGFTFTAADQVVSFAMQNSMKIKGHTLVWHKQLPTWVTNLTTAADVRKAMVDHINGVMNHFKGKVTVWDVVNEALITDGKTGDGNPRIRDSVFSTVLGPTFIDEAFMAARQADSGALLVYNEYASEGLSDKSNAVYDMVKSMKMRGIPIDGVGLQMHIGYNTNPTAADVAANMQRLADLGLKVFISEMDVNSCAGYSDAQEKAQYHDMVAVCVAQPACAAVTVWGITDKFTWLDINNNSSSAAGCATGVLPSALLWDANYVKKSAYTGAMDALPCRSGFDAECVSHICSRHFLEVAKYEGISIKIGQSRQRSACLFRKRRDILREIENRFLIRVANYRNEQPGFSIHR